MSLEARIGIVTGLLIVVVASVYFFYRSDAREGEFLLSANSTLSESPRIPASAEKEATPTVPRRAAERVAQTRGPRRTASARPRSAKRAAGQRTDPRPRRPAEPLQDRRARSGDRKPGGVSTGPRSPDAGGKSPQITRAPGAGQAPAVRGRFPGGRLSTPLRTGPAARLVEATRDNIRPAKPSAAPEKTGGTVSRRAAHVNRSHPSPHTPGAVAPAAGVSRRGSAAASVWPKRHKIAAGDTLSAIAKQYYDDSRVFSIILAANPGIKDPRHLRIGTILTIPNPGASRAITPATAARSTPTHRLLAQRPTPSGESKALPSPSASRKTYRVREGDSFYSIARTRYGSGARWQDIYHLNKALVKNDPKGLKPGMVIQLP